MKTNLKLFLVAAMSTATLSVAAQTQNANDWINESPESGLYGVAANKAYDYLKAKKLTAKAKPIVAIIGTGVDIEHEALKANIWVNKAEKADGKDNDKNGYIDDINGWNFLGGKDGAVMEQISREGDREYMRLRAKYDGLFHDGKRFFRYQPDKIERVYTDEKIDMAEYNYFLNSVRPESNLARVTGGYSFSFMLREYAHIFNNEMKAKYPDKTDFTPLDLASCWDKTGPQDSLRNASMTIIGMFFQVLKTESWNKAFEQYSGTKQIELAKRSADDAFRKAGEDRRKEIVGDDPTDINNKSYGNNILLTANAPTGTMAAGIVAGKRGVEGRNNPLAENAQILPINVCAGGGEPYLKDLALAIRYATDKGASIIVLCQQNTLYPEIGKKWMIDAIRYAESKGVLIIVPTWELSTDQSEKVYYPNCKMAADGKELTNILVVSPSDRRGFPSLNSNYSRKEVDLYAPGVMILSANVGDLYQSGTGTLLAAATTAGVAALVKTYYPELTPAQLKKLLIESCTSRKGVEVEKGIVVKGKPAQDLFLFEQLCVSGGIVNAMNALQGAEKIGK